MEPDLCFSHSKCIWPHSQCPDLILAFILLFFIFLLLLFLHLKLLYSFKAALHKKDCKYICLIWVNVVSPSVLSDTEKEKVRPHTSFGAWESFTEFDSKAHAFDVVSDWPHLLPLYFITELRPCVYCLLFQGTTVCTASCLQLHKRAERIAAVLGDKGHLNAGENVVLLYPPGERWLGRLHNLCY